MPQAINELDVDYEAQVHLATRLLHVLRDTRMLKPLRRYCCRCCLL